MLGVRELKSLRNKLLLIISLNYLEIQICVVILMEGDDVAWQDMAVPGIAWHDRRKRLMNGNGWL